MLCGSLEAGGGPRGRLRRFRSRCTASLPPPLDFSSAARPARLRQTTCATSLCKCLARTRMYAKKPECMGIDALRVIPVTGPRRSAPEGGRSPRTFRTRPPRPSALPLEVPRPVPAHSASGRGRRPMSGSRRCGTSCTLAPEPRWSARNPSRPGARRPLLRPCDGPGPAPAAAAPYPPRSRGRSARVALRIPQGPAASSPRQRSRRRFCRHRPRTASTPKPQIPARTGSRRRQPSSGGFRPATPAERPVNRSVSLGCQGPAAAARRAGLSPVPCGRSATCIFSACRRFDVPQPAIAAGSVSRSG